MSIITTQLGVSDVGYGLDLRRTVVRVKAARAFSAGDLGVLDFSKTTATSIVEGEEASVFNVVENVASINQYSGIIGVWLETVAIGGYGNFLLRGITRAQAFKPSSGVNVTGLGLFANGPTPSNKLSGATAAGKKVIAIALETTTASAVDSGTAETITVLFNGVEGFGGSGV